jgi:hypothetical protein
MSYEIIYQKQFIKAEKNGQEVFVPMIEAGSNNCYEVIRNRRARSWFCDTNILNGKNYGTLDEMLSSTERIRNGLIERNNHTKEQYPDWDTYNDNSFGYYASIAIGGAHTSKTTFKQFEGIYTTGVKKALTVEKLAEYGITTRVFLYIYHNDIEKLKERGYEPFSILVNTSEELIRVLDEKNELLEGSGYRVSITFDGSEREFKDVRKTFSKETKTVIERVDVTEFFTLTDDNGGYFVRNTRNGYRYSFYSTSSTKKFFSEMEAEKFRKKMKNSDRFKVTKVSSYTTLEKRVKI